MLNENTIEKIISENRDKFTVHSPSDSHLDNFLFKLTTRIRNFTSIVPHLVRVAVATAVVFTASVIIWNNYIRRDRNEISLVKKITLVAEKVF